MNSRIFIGQKPNDVYNLAALGFSLSTNKPNTGILSSRDFSSTLDIRAFAMPRPRYSLNTARESM